MRWIFFPFIVEMNCLSEGSNAASQDQREILPRRPEAVSMKLEGVDFANARPFFGTRAPIFEANLFDTPH